MKNRGHGHVFPRPDGIRARCGGPGMCPVCAADLAVKAAETQPTSKELVDQLHAMGDKAYCDMSDQHRKPECLGWEAKVRAGKFGAAELESHRKAAELYGKHLAFREVERLLRTADEPCAALSYDKLRDALAEAMRHAHVPGMVCGQDSDPYPFVDLMSDKGADIGTGEARIRDFAEELADSVLELLDAPAPAPPDEREDPCHPAYVAPLETSPPPRADRVITPVFMICNAYESGFGHGRELDNLPNPYSAGSDEHAAYAIGYSEGERRRRTNGSSGYCNSNAHELCNYINCMCKCHALTKGAEQS